MNLRRPRRHSVESEIYETLHGAILDGSLAPGERLLELHLARHFGTSQTPVREALRRLAHERLVEYRPRRGSYVRMLRLEELEDVYSLRAELEVWAARRFRTRATDNHREHLLSSLDEFDRAAHDADWGAVVKADMQVHRTICEGSGSPLLLEIWTAIDGRVRGFRARTPMPTPAELNRIAYRHRQIGEAVLSGDEDRIELLIRDHMRTVPKEITL